MEWEFIIKLAIALLLGLFIGIDRQLKHKPLGLKTSMIICVASCLITIVSIHAAYTFPKSDHMMMDPMRLAAQIVSGIGFLGAGVILRRNNDSIHGLTSAAMIWAAAGLGIAVGAGFYIQAAAAALLFITATNLMPRIIERLGPGSLSQRDLSVKIVVRPTHRMTELLELIEGKRSEGLRDRKVILKIRHMKLSDLEDGNQHIQLVVSAPVKAYTTEVYYMIKKIDDVMKVEVEYL